MPNPNDPRYDRMLELRLVEGLSLKLIARKFGLTRERVRQIIGNTGHVASDFRKEAINNYPPTVTNQQVAKELGLSVSTIISYRAPNSFYLFDSGNREGHTKSILYVGKKLVAAGHKVEYLPSSTTNDLLVNGRYRVCVRHTNVEKDAPSMRNQSPVWQFSFVGTDEAHFVCCVIKYNEIFVIPRTTFPRGRESVAFAYPTLRPSMSKVVPYLNKFELLA